MLEDLLNFSADGAVDGAAGMGGAGPDGLDFLPDLLAGLTADGLDDRELVAQLRGLEQITSAAAAAKAVLTAGLHAHRVASDAAAGVPGERQGRGVGHEVALARHESPWLARQHVRLGLVLTTAMPHALAALRAGELCEATAMVLVRETTDLTAADQARVDAALASRYGTFSVKDLTIAVRRLVCALDPAGAEDRARRARERRNVTLREIGDGMARLTGQVPAEEAVAALQSLREQADARRQMGDDRTRDQLLADAFLDRLNQSFLPTNQARVDPTRRPADGPHAHPRQSGTHQRGHGQTGRPDAQDGPGSGKRGTGEPADGPAHSDAGEPARTARGVEIQLVMNAAMLLGGDDHPAHVPGSGPIPAGIARDLLADPELEVFIRRLYAHPDDHGLVAMDSRGVLFRAGLRRLLFARDGDTCRTPGCTAPPRHGDHVQPRARGGSTSLDQGQGLCEDCNYVKEQPGWHHDVTSAWPDRHTVLVTTPTGETYESHAPPLPVPPQDPPQDRAGPEEIDWTTLPYPPLIEWAHDPGHPHNTAA